MHEEFKESFKRLGLSFSEIEKSIECPRNYLSRFINGPQTLPSKWEVKIHQFLALHELSTSQPMALGITAIQKEAERLKEKYSPENMELLKNVRFVTPGFTEEMAKKGAFLHQIEAFCAKKGFPPSELIEKFEELEFEILEHKAFQAGLGQNKPNTAPQTGKSGKTTQKEEKVKEGAENDPKTLEEVKALCPKTLVGVDRAIWISLERKKYGI